MRSTVQVASALAAGMAKALLAVLSLAAHRSCGQDDFGGGDDGGGGGGEDLLDPSLLEEQLLKEIL